MIKDLKILGIDKQDTLDVAQDGTCSAIRGLMPTGSVSNPQWRVNWRGQKVLINVFTAGDRFLSMHLTATSLFIWVKIANNDHELWQVTKTTTTFDIKTKLLALSGAVASSVWEAQFSESKKGFDFVIIPDTGIKRMYKKIKALLKIGRAHV